MLKSLLSVSAVLLLVACQQEKAASEPASGVAAKATAATATASASASSAKGVARAVKEENDLYDFEYSYPAQAGGIPDLKAWLDADLARQKADLVKGAKEDKAAAAGESFPYNAHSASSEWKVVTDLPGWLSLSTIVGSFTGGAHPNYGYSAILWDKAANRRREVPDLFQSKAALSDAIRPAFCNALDAQRARKRQVAKIDRGSGDEFDQCIDPLEAALILGSSNHQTFDRIGVLVGPYSAGPYAEGDYEVTLPVTLAILAAVKPEYRAAFAVKR
jgi:hypothetical protein